MKRGLITWDKAELLPAVFDARLSRVCEVLTQRNVSALVVYSDVWRSNQGRYFSNFMPYWNRALLVIAPAAAPALLCALSPRVYPWIRSVTNIDEIRPSPNLAQQLLTMCADKGWHKIGVLDLDALPQDLYAPITGGLDSIVDIPWSTVRSAPDEAELSMYRRAAGLAREILEQEMAGSGGGLDRDFVGRLERRLRLAGAEDLVVFLNFAAGGTIHFNARDNDLVVMRFGAIASELIQHEDRRSQQDEMQQWFFEKAFHGRENLNVF